MGADRFLMREDYFGITVSFNEGLDQWVAIDNRGQDHIGYGDSSISALINYLDKKAGASEVEEDGGEL